MDEPTPENTPPDIDSGLHEVTEKTPARVRARRTRFLAMLRQTANVRAACEEAGISRKTAYKWRSEERWFAEQWAEALEDCVDLADLRAKQLAIEGLLEPVYCAGVICGHRRVYSERLLLRLLERKRPEDWGAPNSVRVQMSAVSTSSTGPVSEQQRQAIRERVQTLAPLLVARYASTLQAGKSA